MGIGPRIGPDIGLGIGLEIGSQNEGVTTDVLSGKKVPATSTEWSTLLSSIGVTGAPVSIYGFQDAASPIADANAVHNLPGIGDSHYRTSMSGWARKGAGHDYVASDNGFVKQHGTLPDPVSNSYLALAYAAVMSDPGVESGIMSLNDAAFYGGMATSTRRATIGAGSLYSTGQAAITLGSVFPYVLKNDNANQVHKFYTKDEILSRTWAAPSANTGEIDYGAALASGVFAADAEYLYGAAWIGSTAEKTDSDVGKILVGMGWDVAWAKTPTPSDSGNSKKFPMATQQWTDLGIAAPIAVWGMQESTGVVAGNYVSGYFLLKQGANLASIGHSGAVAGQTRKGFTFPDGTLSCEVRSLSTSLPSLTTTSCAILVTVKVTAATPAGGGAAPFMCWIAGMGATQAVSMHVGATGIFGVDVNANHTDGAVAQLNTNTPALLVYDVTGSRVILYTAGEKITGVYANQGANPVGIHVGSNSALVPTPAMTVSHVACWSGSSAEFSDTTARALFTALGWSVPW